MSLPPIPISAPNGEPVTVAEAKVLCRVDEDITTDDALIGSLITTGREMAEQELSRALITQTWERVYDGFDGDSIELAWPPVQSIQYVQYIDANGDLQTLPEAYYYLDAVGKLPGFVLLADGYSWPATADTANAVRVRFVCGYGDTAAAVPESIKNWIKLVVADMHPNGDKMSVDQRLRVDRMLDRQRWY